MAFSDSKTHREIHWLNSYYIVIGMSSHHVQLVRCTSLTSTLITTTTFTITAWNRRMTTYKQLITSTINYVSVWPAWHTTVMPY